METHRNGIEARVHTLEAEIKNLKKSMDKLEETNHDEFKTIHDTQSRITGISWGILVAVVGSVVVTAVLK